MSTEVVSQEELAKKAAQWQNMGVAVANTKLKLIQMTAAALDKIKNLPYDPAKILEYESTLKAVKSEKILVVDTRKALTSKLDVVTSTLMLSEKEFDPAIKSYEDALLFVKQTKQKADAIVQQKIDEVKRVREQISNNITSQFANFETLIVQTVSKYYEQSLTKGVSEKNLPETLVKARAYLTVLHFTLVKPTVATVYLTADEVDAIWLELSSAKFISPNNFLEKYVSVLNSRFEFYGIAFKNKEDSLALAKQQAADALEVIADKKDDDAVAAKLDAIASNTTQPVVSLGKKIKSVYKLNMEDSEQTAIQIISAFSANWTTAKEELGIKKWFNLSVKQMGDALVSLKNKDNNFEVSGIMFIQIDKL
jgi:hypothetical protein